MSHTQTTNAKRAAATAPREPEERSPAALFPTTGAVVEGDVWLPEGDGSPVLVLLPLTGRIVAMGEVPDGCVVIGPVPVGEVVYVETGLSDDSVVDVTAGAELEVAPTSADVDVAAAEVEVASLKPGMKLGVTVPVPTY